MDAKNNFEEFLKINKNAIIGGALSGASLPNFMEDAISQANHIEKTKSENLKYLTQQNGEFTNFSKNRSEVNLDKNTNIADINWQ